MLHDGFVKIYIYPSRLIDLSVLLLVRAVWNGGWHDTWANPWQVTCWQSETLASTFHYGHRHQRRTSNSELALWSCNEYDVLARRHTGFYLPKSKIKIGLMFPFLPSVPFLFFSFFSFHFSSFFYMALFFGIFLRLPFLSLSFPLLGGHILMVQLGGLREHCKLPQHDIFERSLENLHSFFRKTTLPKICLRSFKNLALCSDVCLSICLSVCL